MKLARRILFRYGIALALAFFLALAAGGAQAKHNRKGATMGPQASNVLQELLAGNKRFVEGRMVHPHQAASWRREVASGQHPDAAVVACADSRVPPELLFDQGLGDLFVVRVAGNILNAENLGSLEYAAEHLDVRLVVVMGHQRCGAVTAAVKGGEAPGHVSSIVAALKPACEAARASGAGDLVEEASRANVLRQVQAIRESQPILAKLVKEGKLAVVGAYYDLDSGKVEVLKK